MAAEVIAQLFDFSTFQRGEWHANSTVAPPHPRSNHSQPAVLAVISTPLQENPHFSGLFCGFSLRSAIPLAIVQFGPGFSQKNMG